MPPSDVGVLENV